MTPDRTVRVRRFVLEEITSLSRLNVRRHAASPTPFDSNNRSKMSSLSMRGRLRTGTNRRPRVVFHCQATPRSRRTVCAFVTSSKQPLSAKGDEPHECRAARLSAERCSIARHPARARRRRGPSKSGALWLIVGAPIPAEPRGSESRCLRTQVSANRPHGGDCRSGSVAVADASNSRGHDRSKTRGRRSRRVDGERRRNACEASPSSNV